MTLVPAREPAPEAQVIDQAVAWLTLLWSGSADEAAREQWRCWRAAHPAHERAWQHIESVNRRLNERTRGLGADTAVAAISAPSLAGRRQALKALSLAAVSGAGLWAGARELPWREWNADLRTATGERRTLSLADGTELTLNTDSAVDIRIRATERRLCLLRGEILVATAADPVRPARPFVVETPAGQVRPVGTRFVVRQRGHASHVAVLQGAVDLVPTGASAPVLRVGARQAAAFTAGGLLSPAQALGTQADWTDGVLVASNTALVDFIGELQRYHPGKLSCDAAVAGLRLSGTFPLGDTGRVLQSLTEVLPVQLKSFGPWWIRIGPAQA